MSRRGATIAPTLGRTLMLALCLLVSSCQRESSGDVVEISGRLFVFNYRVATATYLVTLRKLKPMPQGSVATAEFENPKAAADPLTAGETIFAIDDRITLTSPPVTCVRKDRPYAVTIRIIDTAGRTIQQLKTTVTSDVDQTVLPTRPLVIGPGYAPNPDVFKHDGQADYGHDDNCGA